MAGGLSGSSGDPGAGLSPSQQRWQAAGDAPATLRASGHSAQARDIGGQDGRAPDGIGAGSPAGERESAGAAPGSPVTPADSRLLKKSLALLAPQSEKAMAYFFATLFVHNPELRPMFPLALDESRQQLFGALTRCIWASDRPESLTGWLTELARDHRKYGVLEHHYQAFGDALLAAVRAFSDGSWSAQTQAAWEAALRHTGATMADAARRFASEPAWWVAEVVEHDQRRHDLAVLTLRPDQPLPYRAGQHVSVQVPRWPRVWREYSIANAPEPDGLLRLHVRAIPGGAVSTALVHQTRAGDAVILGRARGDMTADTVTSHRVACVAGGTGLAPVKAIAEALTGPDRPHPPDVQVFFGARSKADLYDLPSLQRLAEDRPSLTVIPVSEELGFPGLAGALPEVAAAHLAPHTKDIVISGPAGLVARAAEVVPPHAPGARVHLDPLPGGPAAPVPH
jgi:NAD(P)H-flavin reductase/hemoglobin-like flavoprotein